MVFIIMASGKNIYINLLVVLFSHKCKGNLEHLRESLLRKE